MPQLRPSLSAVNLRTCGQPAHKPSGLGSLNNTTLATCAPLYRGELQSTGLVGHGLPISMPVAIGRARSATCTKHTHSKQGTAQHEDEQPGSLLRPEQSELSRRNWRTTFKSRGACMTQSEQQSRPPARILVLGATKNRTYQGTHTLP